MHLTLVPHSRHRLLAEAQGGDHRAFGDLTQAHRLALLAHCYRMLGSLHDAEDALQEALLRAWRGLPNLQADRALRPWLYRITTNACLDALARRPKRVLPIDYAAGEPRERDAVWIEPYPDEQLGPADEDSSPHARYEQREAIELAFVAALQRLNARQRAVLILRDVLGFSARETADILGTSVPAANGALQRARKAIGPRLPERSQQATLRSLGDARSRELVARFTAALEAGDVGAILALLTEDVVFSMPPYPDCARGREAVGESWLMPEGSPGRLRCIPTRANGLLAVACYARDADTGCYLPAALDVLTLRGAAIEQVTAFRTPEAFDRFGLPARLARR